jgi:hypothetical protein
MQLRHIHLWTLPWELGLHLSIGLQLAGAAGQRALIVAQNGPFSPPLSPSIWLLSKSQPALCLPELLLKMFLKDGR